MFVNKTAILEMFKKLISRIFFIRPGYTTSFAGATVFRVGGGGGGGDLFLKTDPNC